VPDLQAVAISGSPRSPSKSKTLAEQMLHALARRGCTTRLIDLASLPAEALLARSEHADVAEAIESVGAARIVVAATPTYRALYTGLLKCFFDLMPQGHLAGKLCLGVQTAAVPHHALSPQYGLAALFASLEGIALPGVYATDDEFVDGKPAEALTARIELAAEAALRMAGGG
jgi:FMN reductase